MSQRENSKTLAELIAILSDETVRTPHDVFQRCHALEQLSVMGASNDALNAITRMLVVPVSVDCVLALRVAAAEAAWKVGRRNDLALPTLAWALKDEYWGVCKQAVRVLGEMGSVAHDAVPNLVNCAERRLDCGPFHFETHNYDNEPDSLLTAIAKALGCCGLGYAHVDAARQVLRRIVDSHDEAARQAAMLASERLSRLL